jgi:hypothetical protein
MGNAVEERIRCGYCGMPLEEQVPQTNICYLHHLETSLWLLPVGNHSNRSLPEPREATISNPPETVQILPHD